MWIVMVPLIFWMFIQFLVGLWIFISPFVLGYRGMMKTTANSMIVGAIVALVALGVAFFHKSVCGYESIEEKKIT
jgi:hypothetical protein